MTGRNYDYILTVDTVANFVKGNTIIGANSSAFAEIVNVDSTNSQLKVKVANVFEEFESGELISTKASLSDFSQVYIANANISAITYSPYIAAKNAFTIDPVVKLYTLYYPGEWYPPNTNGNPTKEGAGYPWPYSFPLRYASVIGDTANDLNYTVTFGGKNYTVFPIDMSPIGVTSTGEANEVTITFSNFDGSIVSLIENPYLVGNSNANATSAYVNNELVNNIDPRTVAGNPDYNSATVSLRGANAALDYETTTILNGVWTRLKSDSRDLLGAVLEVETTYAKFLDYWPEHSTVNTVLTSNSVEIINSSIYRVGDTVLANTVVSGELVTNGGFNSDTSWTKGTGWTISGGAADISAPGSDSGLSQGVDISANKVYDLSFNLGTVSSAGIVGVQYSLDNGNSWANIISLTNTSGSYSIQFTTQNQSLGEGQLRFLANATAVVTDLDSVSLTENIASQQATIVSINGSNVTVDKTTLHGITNNTYLNIVNAEADQYASIKDIYKILRLNSFNEFVVEFSGGNWIQYNVDTLPKRKYLKNTCSFKYKGDRCQYPNQGSGSIANTGGSISANGMFTVNNATTTDPTKDKCAKDYKACALRNNTRHFGGFPNVGNL